jgi:acyl carrier protein
VADHRHNEIKKYIGSKFPADALENDQDIFALGYVNSLFAMELVLFLEKEMGLRIPNEELRMDNFRTIDAMVALMDRAGVRVPASVGE